MSWSDPNSVLNPSTGAVISTAWGDMLNGNLLFLYQPPRCELARVANQSITTNGNISWDTEVLDTDTMWASSPNADRITPQTAGRYLVIVNVGFANMTDTTIRSIQIQKNGSNVANDLGDRRNAENGATTRLNSSVEVYCNGSTDYITVFATESASGSVNLTGRVSCRWVAPS